MDEMTYDALAKARIERAKELLDEAEELLEAGKYKSANNRAFYAIEKSMKALLAKQCIDADYDDFYIADKEECIKQVETARIFYKRTKDYLYQ